MGKVVWKFKDYLKAINSAIDDETLRYAIPAYQLEILQGIYQTFHLL